MFPLPQHASRFILEEKKKKFIWFGSLIFNKSTFSKSIFNTCVFVRWKIPHLYKLLSRILLCNVRLVCLFQ